MRRRCPALSWPLLLWSGWRNSFPAAQSAVYGMDQHRTQRVSEAIREELSEMISFELSDPRVIGVTVTSVEASPDGRHAQVKVALSGDPGEQRRALGGLDHAAPFLRRQLAARLALRRVPELHFSTDRFADADSRIDTLLKRARRRRGETAEQDSNPDADS